MAQTFKNLPAMQETWIWSLGQEDPLEKKGMATHSRIMAWRIPRTEEPGGLQSMVWQRELDMTEQLTHTTILEAFFFFFYKMYMGNGILWIGKPGMLQSMGLQRVGHDWLNKNKIGYKDLEFKKRILCSWFVSHQPIVVSFICGNDHTLER